MTKGELECYRGYGSIEEHVQDYIIFFLQLQQCEEGQQPEKNREMDKGWDSKGAWKQEEGCTLDSIRKLASSILEKEQNSQVFLPALYLRECCRLTETEYWLVMFAFCCELESGLCLHFWKKNNNKWPTLQYALHLLSNVFQVDFALIAKLCGQESPIGDILELPQESERIQGILQQPLLLSRTAFYFLLVGDFRKEKWCEFYLPQAFGSRGETSDGFPGGELNIHEEEYAMLARWLQENACLRVLVNGRRGSGKHTLFKRLISQGGRNGILLNMSYFYREKASVWENMEKSMRLMDFLVNPVIILDFQGLAYGENGDGEEQEIYLKKFLKGRRGAGPIFFLADGAEHREPVRNLVDIQVDLKEFLSTEEKRMVLDDFVSPMERRPWQDELLSRYRLNIGELYKRLKNISFLSGKYEIPLKEKRPWVEGITETNVQNSLGRTVENHYSMEDLIIPKDCRRQLETVIRLAEIWFDGTAGWHGKREGLQMLFHGPSGTGKTMAASVLATQLHLPLFKVDLSRIFDKYVGETEKHLDEIFQMAQRGNYILFFDEADALFSKRMGLRDSHDKYANVATSYLLQRIEMYDGILILATNLMDHFDDAFLRRIRFVIKFRNLEEEDRALLWERLLTGTVLAEGVSIHALAQAAELGPARIRVAVQTAKMLAASENCGELTGGHLRAALELETGKDETALYS